MNEYAAFFYSLENGNDSGEVGSEGEGAEDG